MLEKMTTMTIMIMMVIVAHIFLVFQRFKEWVFVLSRLASLLLGINIWPWIRIRLSDLLFPEKWGPTVVKT